MGWVWVYIRWFVVGGLGVGCCFSWVWVVVWGWGTYVVGNVAYLSIRTEVSILQFVSYCLTFGCYFV